MKKILYLLMSVTMIIGVSCEGEEGPIGPEGPAGPQGAPGPAGLPGQPGEDGTGQSGAVYHVEISFNKENGFGQGLEFGTNVQIDDSDVILVYKFAGYIPGETPEEDILYWEPLPLTIFDREEGIFQYKFLYSELDLSIFMEATFDLEIVELETIYTDEVFFRVVVVPSEIKTDGRSLSPVDHNNYNEVIDYYNLDEGDVIKLNVQ